MLTPADESLYQRFMDTPPVPAASPQTDALAAIPPRASGTASAGEATGAGDAPIESGAVEKLRASYTGSARVWHGVIRRGDSIAWTCPHTHRNREQSTRRNGTSALDCAKSHLRTLGGRP